MNMCALSQAEHWQLKLAIGLFQGIGCSPFFVFRCIVGVVRVRDFSTATEVLQSKVMMFSNQIAEIAWGPESCVTWDVGDHISQVVCPTTKLVSLGHGWLWWIIGGFAHHFESPLVSEVHGVCNEFHGVGGPSWVDLCGLHLWSVRSFRVPRCLRPPTRTQERAFWWFGSRVRTQVRNWVHSHVWWHKLPRARHAKVRFGQWRADPQICRRSDPG